MTPRLVTAHTGGDPDMCPGCRQLPASQVPAILCPGPDAAPSPDLEGQSMDRYHPTEVVYFGSIKKLHFRGFDAYACTCGDTSHKAKPRLELRDEKGRVVLQCVRNTSVQLVPLRPGRR